MTGVHVCGLLTPKWDTLAKSTINYCELPFLLVTSNHYRKAGEMQDHDCIKKIFTMENIPRSKCQKIKV
jgi:hypothetical protein